MFFMLTKTITCRASDIIEVIRCQVIDFSGLRVVAVNCIMCEAGLNDVKPADETQTNTVTSCPCLVWENTHMREVAVRQFKGIRLHSLLRQAAVPVAACRGSRSWPCGRRHC